MQQPPGWDPNRQQWQYPPQQQPPTVIVQSAPSGCSTAFWFVVILFVILPMVSMAGCLVCANLSRH
jgi:hypothetical protein